MAVPPAAGRRVTVADVTLEELLVKLRAPLEARADVKFALLFGSSALRGPDQARDVDVAVALSAPLSLLDLSALACELEAATGRDVDLVDLGEAPTLLRWQVLRYGRVILTRDRDACLSFQARVPIEHADLQFYFERESEGLRRALREVKWSASTSSATKSAG